MSSYLKQLSVKIKSSLDDDDDERLRQTKHIADDIPDDPKMVHIIKMDSRFQKVVSNLVDAVKYYDALYPEISAEEIFFAMVNDAMADLFPQVK